MTDQELLGAARQTLNMARTDRELTGWPSSIVIASYHVRGNPPLHRMRRIEALLQSKLGEGWLDDGAKKDRGFYVLRLATAAMPPDAVVIATPTNMFWPTAKQTKATAARVKKVSETPEGRRQLVAEGLFELVDSLTAVAQTSQRVCTCMQPVARGGVFQGEPQVMHFDQAQFDGRMKMFGAEVSQEDTREIAKFQELLKRKNYQ